MNLPARVYIASHPCLPREKAEYTQSWCCTSGSSSEHFFGVGLDAVAGGTRMSELTEGLE